MNNNLEVTYNHFFDQQYEVGITIRDFQNNFKEHTHDYIEIVCQINGDIDHIINNVPFQVMTNQMIIIGIGDVHKNIASNSKSLIILISEKYLNNIVIESAFDPDVIALQKYISTQTPIVLDLTYSMTEILIKLEGNYVNNSCAYYIKQRILITQFILELNLNFKNSKNILLNNTDLITYIFNNIKNASLNDYANIIHYSPVTTGNKIKCKYGKTFSQIVKQIRLKKAADLLSKGDLPISQIMEDIGYTNKTYFYKNFKEVYNLSPAKYRSLFRK